MVLLYQKGKSGLLVFALSLLQIGLGDDKNYGAFDLLLTKANTCHGPKSRDCTVLEVGLVPGGKVIALDVEVFENVKPEIGKISSFTLNQQSAMTPLVRLQMNKPCEHMLLRPLFDLMFNFTDNCVVRKGAYKYNIDIAKLAEGYFGGKFLYGNFSFKAVFTSKDCNFACARVDVNLKPKQ